MYIYILMGTRGQVRAKWEETSAPGLRSYLVTFLPFDLVDAVHPTTQAGGCVGICSYIPKDLPNIHKDVRSHRGE